jgi:cellulose synthase/poly-beta-1,6-N-acetylglucosamine synthase-like glycosyltransferase
LTVSRSHQRPIDMSVVVVAYNMAREMLRTLLSLSASYQRDIHADDYEVIVVDNGSTPPLDPAVIGNRKATSDLFESTQFRHHPPTPSTVAWRQRAARLSAS